MKKFLIAALLVFETFAWAEECYFQNRRTRYDSGTNVRKISCQTVKNVINDIRFYDGSYTDNDARYYGQKIGREGNLISEEDGKILIIKFYYALGEYRYYGQIGYRGANVDHCVTATSSGRCDQVEYNDFAMYLRDFLSSPARNRN